MGNGGAIYVINEDGGLSELREAGYDSEDLLQGFLARYPDLLAGDQINPDSPRRWLLVSREAGIPGDETGVGRWAVDHLFLDQDGIPTLVEVKRSSDTRIRREVVGQMLDYAANCLNFWSAETIRANFEAQVENSGVRADTTLAAFLSASADPDSFWSLVRTNLGAGRLRLLFVADVIPIELQRVIEFLNRHMDSVEVLGIEIHQYASESLKTLVPRVVGQTTQKVAGPGRSRARRQWDMESFRSELASQDDGSQLLRNAESLVSWASDNGMRFTFGSGAVIGSFIPAIDSVDDWYSFFAIYTDGRVEMQFGYLLDKPPFDKEKLQEFLERLNQVEGIALDPERAARFPAFNSSVLSRPATMAAFLDVLDWAMRELREAVAVRE